MAKMSSEISLLCRHGPETLGLAHGPSTDALVVTIQGDGVIQYKIGSQERHRGWSLGNSRLTFLSPAVFNPALNAYFAAVQDPTGNQQILSWNTNTGGLLDKSAARVTLPKPVHSIHPTAQSIDIQEEGASAQPEAEASFSGRHAGVFVVFADGTVGLESFYSNGRSGQPLGREGRITAVCSGSGKVAVAVLEDSQSYAVAIYEAKEGILREPKYIQLASPEAGAALDSLSMHRRELSVLWSQGTVQSYFLLQGRDENLHLRFQATRKLKGFESEEQSKAAPKLRNGKTQSRKNSKRKTTAVTNGVHQLPTVVSGPGSLMATLSWMGDEAEGSKRLRMTLLDSMHCTARRVQDFTLKELGMPAKAAGLQGIHVGEDSTKLAVLAGGTVFLVDIEEPQPTLATLVGALSQSSSRKPALAAREAFHADEWAALRPPGGRHRVPPWLPRGNFAEKLDPEELRREIAIPLPPRDNGGAEPPQDDISTFGDLAATCSGMIHSAASYSSQSAAQELVDYLCNSSQQGGTKRAALLTVEQTSVLMYSLAEQGYWEELERVCAHVKLEAWSTAPGLLPLVTKAKRHKFLAEMLPKVRHIPGADLAESLQHLLGQQPGQPEASWAEELCNTAEQAVSSAEQDQGANAQLQECACSSVAAVQHFSTQDVVLHPFVAAKLDDALLLRALKGITTGQARRLASYLHTWLQSLTEFSASLEGFQWRGIVVPPLEHIIQWLSRLIDAHLVGLAMDRNSAELVESLQRHVARHSRGLSSYSALLGCLKPILQKAPLPKQDPGPTLFSAKLLNISV